MIFDDLYERYEVVYPFQITRFRSLVEHCWEGEHTFLGESHNFWEVMYVLEGRVEFVQDGKIHLLEPGSLMGCPPMVFHSSHSEGAPIRCLNFCFEHIGTVPQILSEGVMRLTEEEGGEMTAIFRRLCGAYRSVPADYMTGAEAANAMASFLLRLSQHHTPHVQYGNSHSSVMYQKLVETMRAGLHENLSMQEIARRNSIGVTTMKELFHKYSGISPKQYYSEMRGLEALRLLEIGMEITEIAEKLNFSSPNYFSSFFKNRFGSPPGQYRNTHCK